MCKDSTGDIPLSISVTSWPFMAVSNSLVQIPPRALDQALESKEGNSKELPSSQGTECIL